MLGSAFGNVTYLGLPVLLETFPSQAEQVSEVAVLFEVTKSSLNLSLGAMIDLAAPGEREFLPDHHRRRAAQCNATGQDHRGGRPSHRRLTDKANETAGGETCGEQAPSC